MFQQYALPAPARIPESSAGLLGKVLGIVAVGFLFTAAGSYLMANISSLMASILGLVGLGLVFSIHALRDDPPVQLTALYAFTFIEGGFLAPTMKHHVKSIGVHGVAEAAAVTATGMAVIGCIAYLFSINYRKLSGIGLAALLALLIVMVVNVFVHFMHPNMVDYLVLAVFSLITLIDFARLRDGGDGATAVELALSIYLDALNIFLAALDLFSGGKEGTSWD